MTDFKQCHLILECAKCSMLNYMDPFTFWNFSGKTKCAGCDAVYAVTYSNGQKMKGPDAAEGKPDRLPGFAQTKDFKTQVTTSGKVSPPSYARDPENKHGPTYKNVRGNLVAAGKLSAADLVGSRARFIAERTPYKPAS
ncbi:MAG: hypothetical protein ACE5IQ_13065 [Candidatus Methylomirabilales bacterium]